LHHRGRGNPFFTEEEKWGGRKKKKCFLDRGGGVGGDSSNTREKKKGDMVHFPPLTGIRRGRKSFYFLSLRKI